MSHNDDFDGYRKWLGISTPRRPPSHYDVLGIKLNEEDHEVILAAAEQRRTFVESKRGIGYDDQVAEILLCIDEAELTLLNNDLRREYDRRIDLFAKRRKGRQVDPSAARSVLASKPGRAIGEDYGIVKTFGGIVAVLCIAFAGMSYFAFNLMSRQKLHTTIEQPPIVQQQDLAGPVAALHEMPTVDSKPPRVPAQKPIPVPVTIPMRTAAQTAMEKPPNLVNVKDVSNDKVVSNSLDHPQTESSGPRVTSDKPEEEILLLGEQTLERWESSPGGDKSNWSLNRGVLKQIKKGPSLVTNQKFEDFDLHLEFKLPSKCNSGIYLRGRYEVQLLDSDYRNKAGQPVPAIGSTGAIWGKIPPAVNAYKGPNKWNGLDVRLVERKVTVRLNGTLIIDSQFIDGVTGQGFLDDQEADPGPILLQSADVIGAEFRDIRIKPLWSSKAQH
ncbi:3-keto-disaccharide hydrolase [Schlesneria paludicola]|uniref:3-keto-disaccharide hydrolase n=1 Tax=Schlesneria paludicola TaxID=360056 RepID=UPI00029B3ECA|nr:DUF1080 domain-containing protein [Schlesneria paludicola]